MRKYAVALLTLIVLFGMITLQAKPPKRVPPGPTTVATHELRNLSGGAAHQVYVPAEAGMYRISVYKTSHSGAESGTLVLSWSDEANYNGGSGIGYQFATTSVWSVANQPISVRLADPDPSHTYSLFVTVERI